MDAKKFHLASNGGDGLKAFPKPAEATDASSRVVAFMLRQANLMLGAKTGVQRPLTSQTVHEMRVASRRLQAGLDLFDRFFPEAELGEAVREIGRIRRKLGKIRTIDVNLELMNQFMEAGGGAARAAAWARHPLSERRTKRELDLDELFEKLETAGFLAELRLLILRLKPGLRRPELVRHACRELARNQKKFRKGYQRFVRKKGAASLHRFRIAAKKYRYALEVCQSAFQLELKKEIRAASKLQSLAGKIHDEEMAADALRRVAFPKDERELKKGCDDLIRRCERKAAGRLRKFRRRVRKSPLAKHKFQFSSGR